MSVIKVSYTVDLKLKWDNFVQNISRNGTLFHEQHFLSYHSPGKFKDASILFFKNTDNIYGVFSAALIEIDGKKILCSHPGSSYGGLIYSPVCTVQDVMEMLEEIINHAREIGASQIEIRLPENLIFSDPPDQEFSFLLWHRGFRLKSRELSSTIDLKSAFSQHFLANKTYQWSVNRSRREGVIVRSDIDIEKIYPLISGTLNDRYQKHPAHTCDELCRIKSLYPERIKAWTALKDEKPIGVVIVFETNKRTVHDFYIAQDYNFTKLQTLYLIFDTLLQYYREKNFHYFNFGISSRQQWIKWGILGFKEGIGGRATVRESWILEDVNIPKPFDGNPDEKKAE